MVTDRQMRKELERRARVVHGWFFRTHTRREIEAIRAYLSGGDAGKLPQGYQKLHKTVK
jgi:hypothetical protein